MGVKRRDKDKVYTAQYPNHRKYNNGDSFRIAIRKYKVVKAPIHSNRYFLGKKTQENVITNDISLHIK